MFLNKLYKAIIKRKSQRSMGISKFMAPDPLVHYTSLYRINTSGVKNRLLVKIVENVKSWYCENILRKQQQLLTIFAKCSIVHVWQGSEYASVSNFEYSRVLIMPGVRQGSEYARIIFEHAWIFLNMPKYAWMCLNLPEWQMFYFPIVIPYLLKRLVTYFSMFIQN